jgi:hypothetical protein
VCPLLRWLRLSARCDPSLSSTIRLRLLLLRASSRKSSLSSSAVRLWLRERRLSSFARSSLRRVLLLCLRRRSFASSSPRSGRGGRGAGDLLDCLLFLFFLSSWRLQVACGSLFLGESTNEAADTATSSLMRGVRNGVTGWISTSKSGTERCSKASPDMLPASKIR